MTALKSIPGVMETGFFFLRALWLVDSVDRIAILPAPPPSPLPSFFFFV